MRKRSFAIYFYKPEVSETLLKHFFIIISDNKVLSRARPGRGPNQCLTRHLPVCWPVSEGLIYKTTHGLKKKQREKNLHTFK